MASDKQNLKTGAGCLMLFALPFAAAGVVMAVLQLRSLLSYQDMQSWEAVPARIVHADLKVINGAKSTTWQVTAQYTYDYQGKAYAGDRVSLYSAADNIGSFQRDTFAELEAHRRAGAPLPCYVDPGRPSEAILYRDLRWEMVCFNTLCVLVFGGVGFGLLIAGVSGYRQARAKKVRAAEHPDEPWLWKQEWAGGEIVSSHKNHMLLWFTAALFWNIVSLPVYAILPSAIGKGSWALATLFFPAVGLLLLGRACVWLWRQRIYGDSAFHLASVPGVIGGQLAGVINTATKIRPEDGFHLELNCIQKTSTGRGKSERTTEESIWQDEQVIAHELLELSPDRSSIPVLFTIPFDCRPTAEDEKSSTTWRLEVRAKVPGLDYREHFDVPVFKTAASDANFVANTDAIAGYLAPDDPAGVLSAAGILKTVSPNGDGTRFVFPRGRNLGAGLSIAIFLIGWTAAIWLMQRLGAPLFFPIVFGAFEALILWIAADIWFYRSEIDVSSRDLIVTAGLFGQGRSRHVAPADVAKITLARGMRSGMHPYYNLVVKLHDGREIVAGKNLPGMHLAKVAVQQIEQALGKKMTSSA